MSPVKMPKSLNQISKPGIGDFSNVYLSQSYESYGKDIVKNCTIS